jgi:hypothetical protein
MSSYTDEHGRIVSDLEPGPLVKTVDFGMFCEDVRLMVKLHEDCIVELPSDPRIHVTRSFLGRPRPGTAGNLPSATRSRRIVRA